MIYYFYYKISYINIALSIGKMKRITLFVFIFFASVAFDLSAQVISTFAGTGGAGNTGDGGLAVNAAVFTPTMAAIEAGGALYVSVGSGHKVRKVNGAGIISTYAGNGIQGFSGDGGSAASAQLNFPAGIAFDGLGNCYICDMGNHRIRKVNSSGIISTYAGTGIQGFSGDGGLATAARISNPCGVVVDAVGNLFFTEIYDHRVRRISPSGIISTIAGTGIAGFSGDNGAAALAQLKMPIGISLDAVGNLYIADANNNRIRKINTGGIISTVAGTGVGGYNGDGITALTAQLRVPTGIAFDSQNEMFIADAANSRIRKVNLAGIISTYVGIGSSGFSGDGGLANLAQISDPTGIVFDASDNLYICDDVNRRVRKVTCSPPSQPGAISGNTLICLNSVNVYSLAPVSGATSYSWSMPGGWSGNSTSNVISITTNGGVGTITVTCKNACGTSSQTTLLVATTVTSLTLSSDVNSGCPGTCINFSFTPNTVSSFSLNWGDGSVITPLSSNHCYTMAGTYSVSALATDVNGCPAFIPTILTATIFPGPSPGFNISGGNTQKLNTAVSFNNTSNGANRFSWYFGDNSSVLNTIIGGSVSHTFTGSGNYCVKLVTVDTVSSCKDSILSCFDVVCLPEVNFPNVFTPNGDENNDLFTFKCTCIKNLKCSVFNRWGVLIYEWEGIHGGWDGRTASGQAVSEGVYYYVVEFTEETGGSSKRKGFIDLFIDQ